MRIAEFPSPFPSPLRVEVGIDSYRGGVRGRYALTALRYAMVGGKYGKAHSF